MAGRDMTGRTSVILSLLLGGLACGALALQARPVSGEHVDVSRSVARKAKPESVQLAPSDLHLPPPPGGVEQVSHKTAQPHVPPAPSPTVSVAQVSQAPKLQPVKREREEKPEPKPDFAQQEPDKKPAPAEIDLSRTAAPEVVSTVREGRVLLRLLERGAGPQVEIAWPDDAAARDRLYALLVGRLGMRSGFLDADAGMFYGPEGAERLDFDRYSLFVRYPSGASIAGERADVARASPGHGSGIPSVRLFPRGADALLLGGLSRLVGPGYDKTGILHARYHVDGTGVMVGDVVADGRAVAGNIRLIRP